MPVEYRKLTDVLVTNWGLPDAPTGEGERFWICPDCGRHQSHDPSKPAHEKPLAKWREWHGRFCSGEPRQLVLAHQFQADCIVVTVPAAGDADPAARRTLSPTLLIGFPART